VNKYLFTGAQTPMVYCQDWFFWCFSVGEIHPV